MKTRLVRRAPEPDGVLVVAVANVEVRAIDRLARGGSPQPVPLPGAEFDASFSYQLDPEREPRLLPADATEPPSLRSMGACSAEAVGQILSIDSVSADGRVLVAQVDCGGWVLPAPMDVTDAALIGQRVAFTIAELEVWRR